MSSIIRLTMNIQGELLIHLINRVYSSRHYCYSQTDMDKHANSQPSQISRKEDHYNAYHHPYYSHSLPMVLSFIILQFSKGSPTLG